MNRALLGGLLLALCFLSGQSSISRADDAKPKKDSQKKDDDKSRDKKPDGVKRAQTTSVGTFSGKLTKVDDAMLAFEAGQGRAKKTIEDVIIADDVKVRLPAEPEFDSKGKLKKFKPDPNDPDRGLGGVKGSKDDLREGQQVVIKLGKHNKKLVATVIVVLPEEKK
jgi:hypothetical protein